MLLPLEPNTYIYVLFHQILLKVFVLNIFRFNHNYIFLYPIDDVLIICKSIILDNSRIFISLNSIHDLLEYVLSNTITINSLQPPRPISYCCLDDLA